jgi:4-hydroxythreonine-4-phosphate dehydrogenase
MSTPNPRSGAARTVVTADRSRPLLALAMGDPCGISPELTARMVADPAVAAAARLVVIGDRRILEMGARDAGIALDIPAVSETAVASVRSQALLDLGHLAPDQVQRGVASREGGAFAVRNFIHALELARDGKVDAVTFTPFNKQAMRMARDSYDDEIALITEVLGAKADGREFNVLESLWNARVTSHIPLKDVSSYLSTQSIAQAGRLADRCRKAAGTPTPRIAVAALNPHAGDGGNFGREEIDLIAPAVKQLQAEGIHAVGPIPADTVFVRAKKGEFDMVLTMYHDQGQIAMKLMGFEQGVTFLGGYSVPICTPAHGTAYDIAGRGIADIDATRNALLLAAEMATQQTPALTA